MTYVSATGKHLASMSAAFGVVDAAGVEIARGDLAGIWHEAARSGGEYIFGDSVTGMAEVPGAVEVTFERAGPRTFDLVIGAGGLHSALRALAFGPEPSFVRHLGMYLAVFTVPKDMGLDHWQLIHVVPGKSVTVTSARDSTGARVIFFFASPPLDYDHRDIGQQQELLQAAYAGQGREIPRLLAAMRDAPGFYFDSVSQIRMDTWPADRVALAGDAGYCPSQLPGQGTSLALAGGYVLAGALQAAGGDHGAAFAAYQRRMRDFADRNQQIAVGNTKRFIPQTRRQIWLQNQAIRTLPCLPGNQLVPTWPPRASGRQQAPSRWNRARADHRAGLGNRDRSPLREPSRRPATGTGIIGCRTRKEPDDEQDRRACAIRRLGRPVIRRAARGRVARAVHRARLMILMAGVSEGWKT